MSEGEHICWQTSGFASGVLLRLVLLAARKLTWVRRIGRTHGRLEGLDLPEPTRGNRKTPQLATLP